jgi:hypothetical protein
MVWPWQPINSTPFNPARMAARAYCSPSSKCRRAMAAVVVVVFETSRIACRSRFGYGVD